MESSDSSLSEDKACAPVDQASPFRQDCGSISKKCAVSLLPSPPNHSRGSDLASLGDRSTQNKDYLTLCFLVIVFPMGLICYGSWTPFPLED